MIFYARVIVSIKFIVLYAAPLISVATFYTLMARKLMHSSRHPVGQENATHARQLELRIKLARMVLALVAIFAFCFLPNHIFMMWFYYTWPDSYDKNYNDFWHVLKIMGYCLTFANSALNPVVLYFISGKFRAHFKRYVLCWFYPRRRRLQRTVTYRITNTSNSGSNYCSTSVKSGEAHANGSAANGRIGNGTAHGGRMNGGIANGGTPHKNHQIVRRMTSASNCTAVTTTSITSAPNMPNGNATNGPRRSAGGSLSSPGPHTNSNGSLRNNNNHKNVNYMVYSREKLDQYGMSCNGVGTGGVKGGEGGSPPHGGVLHPLLQGTSPPTSTTTKL